MSPNIVLQASHSRRRSNSVAFSQSGSRPSGTPQLNALKQSYLHLCRQHLDTRKQVRGLWIIAWEPTNRFLSRPVYSLVSSAAHDSCYRRRRPAKKMVGSCTKGIQLRLAPPPLPSLQAAGRMPSMIFLGFLDPEPLSLALHVSNQGQDANCSELHLS